MTRPNRVRSPRERQRWRQTQWIVIALLLLAEVFGFIAFRERLPIAILAGVVLIAFTFIRSVVRDNPPAGRMLVVVVTLIVLAWCAASFAYGQYKTSIEHLDWTLNIEAFRHKPSFEQWPVYGKSDDQRWPHALLMFPATAVLGWIAIVLGPRLVRSSQAQAVLLLCIAAAATMFAFGLGDRPERTLAVYHDGQFAEDFAFTREHGIGLNAYAAHMDELSWFGTHYPPGFMLLYGPSPVLGSIAILLGTAGAIGLTFVATLTLGGSRQVAWWSAALLGCGPLVLMLPTVSSSAVLLTFAAGAVALCGVAIRGRTSTSRLAAAGGLGLVLAAWSFFSFSVGLFAVSLVVTLTWLVMAKRLPLSRAVLLAMVVGATVVTALGLLWLTTGYDALATFAEASANHHEQIGGRRVPPDETAHRWMLRSVGNVVAWLAGHLPLTAVAIAGLVSLRGNSEFDRIVKIAAASALLVISYASLSGTFVLETERIWMFFLASLCPVAAAWMVRAQQTDSPATAKTVVGLSLVLALLTELVWKPFL